MMLGKGAGIATGGLGLAADQLMAFDELGSGPGCSSKTVTVRGGRLYPRSNRVIR